MLYPILTFIFVCIAALGISLILPKKLNGWKRDIIMVLVVTTLIFIVRLIFGPF